MAPVHLDLSVYVIIDPQCCAGRPPEDVAVMAARGGATLIQYRDKEASFTQVRDGAQRVLGALLPYDVPFVVNDYPQIAKDIGADGVHIGQGDMPPHEVRALLGADAIVGLTAFTPAHLAAVDPKVVDYVGTGPVYPTKTDKGKPILGVEGLGALVALSPVPMVAIGGITDQNAAAVMQSGVQGIAVMRGVSAASEPQQATQNLLKIVSGRKK